MKRIATQHDRIHFCYEAGPTGYGLHRLITSLGHSCIVVAPFLIPRKPGDQVKTNRRDAIALAKLLRAGELTAVWVPDEGHEAMRDLVRARAAAVGALRVHRQQVSAFMLKHGRVFPRKKAGRYGTCGGAGAEVRTSSASDRAAGDGRSGSAFEGTCRLEQTIEEFAPSWSLAPVVRALQSLRGVDLIVAVTFATESGDVRRFESPRQLMGFLGLVSSERSGVIAIGLNAAGTCTRSHSCWRQRNNWLLWIPAERATSEATAPGSSAAATIRSFSARDQLRRRCTDVITSIPASWS